MFKRLRFENVDLVFAFQSMFNKFDYLSVLEGCCKRQDVIDEAFDDYKSERNSIKMIMQFACVGEELSDERAEEIIHIVENVFFSEKERESSERLSNKAIAQVCASMVKYL